MENVKSSKISLWKKIICCILSVVLVAQIAIPKGVAFAEEKKDNSAENSMENLLYKNDLNDSYEWNEDDLENDDGAIDVSKIDEKLRKLGEIIGEKKNEATKAYNDFLNTVDNKQKGQASGDDVSKAYKNYLDKQKEVSDLEAAKFSLEILRKYPNVKNAEELEKILNDRGAWNKAKEAALQKALAQIAPLIAKTLDAFAKAIKVQYKDGKRVVILDDKQLKDFFVNGLLPNITDLALGVIATLISSSHPIIGPIIGGLGGVIHGLVKLILALTATPPDREDKPTEYQPIFDKIDECTKQILEELKRQSANLNSKFSEIKTALDNMKFKSDVDPMLRASSTIYTAGKVIKSNFSSPSSFFLPSDLREYFAARIDQKGITRDAHPSFTMEEVYNCIVESVIARQALFTARLNIKKDNMDDIIKPAYKTRIPIKKLLTNEEYRALFGIYLWGNGQTVQVGPENLIPEAGDTGNIAGYAYLLTRFINDPTANVGYKSLVTQIQRDYWESVQKGGFDKESKFYSGLLIENGYAAFFAGNLRILCPGTVKSMDYKAALQIAKDRLKTLHEHNMAILNDMSYVMGAYALCKAYEGNQDFYTIEEMLKNFQPVRNELNKFYNKAINTIDDEVSTIAGTNQKSFPDSLIAAAEVIVFPSGKKKTTRTFEEALDFAHHNAINNRLSTRIVALKDVDSRKFSEEKTPFGKDGEDAKRPEFYDKSFHFPVADTRNSNLAGNPYATIEIDLNGFDYHYINNAIVLDTPSDANVDDIKGFGVTNSNLHKKSKFIYEGNKNAPHSAIKGPQRERATTGPALCTNKKDPNGNYGKEIPNTQITKWFTQSLSLYLRNVDISNCPGAAIDFACSNFQDSISIDNCSFTGNKKSALAIGMYSKTTINKSSFVNNTNIGGDGGAIHFVNNPLFVSPFENFYYCKDLSHTNRHGVSQMWLDALKQKKQVARSLDLLTRERIQIINTQFYGNGEVTEGILRGTRVGRGGAICIDKPLYMKGNYFEGKQPWTQCVGKLKDYMKDKNGNLVEGYDKITVISTSCIKDCYDFSYAFYLNRLQEAYFYIKDCTFEGNKAKDCGGAIAYEEGTHNLIPIVNLKFDFVRCNFNRNDAGNCGGAFYFQSKADFTNRDLVNQKNWRNYYIDINKGKIICRGYNRFHSCNFDGNTVSNKDNAGSTLYNYGSSCVIGAFINGGESWRTTDTIVKTTSSNPRNCISCNNPDNHDSNPDYLNMDKIRFIKL